MEAGVAESMWGGGMSRRDEDEHGDSVWSAWTRTVDHWTIGACFLLFAIGVVLSFAVSPSLVARQGAEHLTAFHYAWRHMLFGLPAFLALFVCSFLGARGVKRAGALMAMASIAAMALLLIFGVAHGKASVRWLSLFGMSLQPTEFLKPGLVVACGWMLAALAHADRSVGRAGVITATVTVAVAVALLILQPDYSQAALLLTVWGGMFFVAGGSIVLLACVGGAGLLVGVVAYVFEPHFASRIDRFLDGEGYQVQKAQEAVINGGFWGRGVDGGVAKTALPDAHADFILAVAAEEFGFALALVIILLFAMVVGRAMWRVAQAEDAFVRVAGSGLALLVGLQAFVNVAVTAQMVPVTGVTLPFISYGGSSMVATGATMGMLLALTRRRPRDFTRDLDPRCGSRRGVVRDA